MPLNIGPILDLYPAILRTPLQPPVEWLVGRRLSALTPDDTPVGSFYLIPGRDTRIYRVIQSLPGVVVGVPVGNVTPTTRYDPVVRAEVLPLSPEAAAERPLPDDQEASRLPNVDGWPILAWSRKGGKVIPVVWWAGPWRVLPVGSTHIDPHEVQDHVRRVLPQIRAELAAIGLPAPQPEPRGDALPPVGQVVTPRRGLAIGQAMAADGGTNEMTNHGDRWIVLGYTPSGEVIVRADHGSSLLRSRRFSFLPSDIEVISDPRPDPAPVGTTVDDEPEPPVSPGDSGEPLPLFEVGAHVMRDDGSNTGTVEDRQFSPADGWRYRVREKNGSRIWWNEASTRAAESAPGPTGDPDPLQVSSRDYEFRPADTALVPFFTPAEAAEVRQLAGHPRRWQAHLKAKFEGMGFVYGPAAAQEYTANARRLLAGETPMRQRGLDTQVAARRHQEHQEAVRRALAEGRLPWKPEGMSWEAFLSHEHMIRDIQPAASEIPEMLASARQARDPNAAVGWVDQRARRLGERILRERLPTLQPVAPWEGPVSGTIYRAAEEAPPELRPEGGDDDLGDRLHNFGGLSWYAHGRIIPGHPNDPRHDGITIGWDGETDTWWIQVEIGTLEGPRLEVVHLDSWEDALARLTSLLQQPPGTPLMSAGPTPPETFSWVDAVLPIAETKLGIRLGRTPLGSGWNGQVFPVEDDPARVVKITASTDEVRAYLHAARTSPHLTPDLDRIVLLGDIDRSPDPGQDSVAYAILRAAVTPLDAQVWEGPRVPRDVLRESTRLTLYEVPENVRFGWTPQAGRRERHPLAWASDAGMAVAHFLRHGNAPQAKRAMAEYLAWLDYTDATRTGARPVYPEDQRRMARAIRTASVGAGAFHDFGPNNQGTTSDGRLVVFDLGYVPQVGWDSEPDLSGWDQPFVRPTPSADRAWARAFPQIAEDHSAIRYWLEHPDGSPVRTWIDRIQGHARLEEKVVWPTILAQLPNEPDITGHVIHATREHGEIDQALTEVARNAATDRSLGTTLSPAVRDLILHHFAEEEAQVYGPAAARGVHVDPAPIPPPDAPDHATRSTDDPDAIPVAAGASPDPYPGDLIRSRLKLASIVLGIGQKSGINERGTRIKSSLPPDINAYEVHADKALLVILLKLGWKQATPRNAHYFWFQPPNNAPGLRSVTIPDIAALPPGALLPLAEEIARAFRSDPTLAQQAGVEGISARLRPDPGDTGIDVIPGSARGWLAVPGPYGLRYAWTYIPAHTTYSLSHRVHILGSGVETSPILDKREELEVFKIHTAYGSLEVTWYGASGRAPHVREDPFYGKLRFPVDPTPAPIGGDDDLDFSLEVEAPPRAPQAQKSLTQIAEAAFALFDTAEMRETRPREEIARDVALAVGAGMVRYGHTLEAMQDWLSRDGYPIWVKAGIRTGSGPGLDLSQVRSAIQRGYHSARARATGGQLPAGVAPAQAQASCVSGTFTHPTLGPVVIACEQAGKRDSWHNIVWRGTRYGFNGTRWARGGTKPPQEILDFAASVGATVFGGNVA